MLTKFFKKRAPAAHRINGTNLLLKMQEVYDILAKRSKGQRERSAIMIWNENRENAYCEITPAIMAL